MTPRKVAYFSIGPAGGALLGLITIPITTWYFSQEVVGKISMLHVALGFSTLFFSLGLDQAYVREYHEVEDKPALLKTALFPGMFILTIFLLTFLSMDSFFSQMLFNESSQKLSYMIALVLMVSFISRFLSLVLRMNERGLAYSMSQLISKVVLLLVISLYVFFDFANTLHNLVIANTLAVVTVFSIFLLNTRQNWLAAFSAKFDFQALKRMLKYGLPLILGGVAYWGLTAIDKVFLRLFSNFEQLGLYAVSVSFAGVATILQSIFSTIWAPTVYKWVSKGEGIENIDMVTRYILCLVVFIFCFVGLFSWVVTLFLPSEYISIKWILVACLGAPLMYTLSETTVVGIGVSRRSEFSMLATVAAFCLNGIGNWFLIPKFGAAGAAISTFFSFWFFLILRTELAIYLWKPIKRQRIYGYSGLILVATTISALYGKYTELFSSLLVFWIVLFCVALFDFKSELSTSYTFLNKKFNQK